MATSPAPPNLDQGWSPEPELREPTPRRIEPVFDFDDLNKPNVTMFSAAGGALAAVGVCLFIYGLISKNMFSILGGLTLAGGGAAMLVIFPQKAKAYEERVRDLVSNGMPTMANVLTSENLTGDSMYGRTIKYQVALPGGEVVNRDVNADERRLPKQIPGKATALVNLQSGEVELYCAMPFRAVARSGASSAAPTPVYVPPTPIPTAPSVPTPTPQPTGSMGTLGSIGTSAPATPPTPAPERPAPRRTPPPAAPAPQPETTTPPPADNKLPWE